jgi:hypothetical protein
MANKAGEQPPMFKTNSGERSSSISFEKLRPGKDNNYQEWLPKAKSFLSQKYGPLATVWTTFRPYIHPAVRLTDYTPEIGPAILAADGTVAVAALLPLSAAELTKLRVKAEENRNARIQAMKDQWKSCWEDTMSMMSEESKVEASTHPDYLNAEMFTDPNQLAVIINNTHLSAYAGDVGMEDFEEELVDEEFNRLKQNPGESLGLFYQRFQQTLLRRSAAGLPDITPAKLGLKFFRKVDQIQHNEVVTDATNKKNFPTSLADAYSRVSKWKSVNKPISFSGYKSAAGGRLQAVMVAETTVVKKKLGKQFTGGNDPRADQPFKGRCDNCDKLGHAYYECPDPLPPGLVSRMARRQLAQSGQVASAGGGRGSGRGGGRGNWGRARGAPVSAPAALVTYDDDGVGEDDEEDGVVFVITSSEVISSAIHLDSQSSDHVFNDSSLVTRCELLPRPRKLGGINGSADSLTITEQGLLGIIGSVGISVQASANVLSRSRLRDDGFSISYDNSRDVESIIFPNGTTLEFSRPVGYLRSHYVCTMDDLRIALNKSTLGVPVEETSRDVFVTTVAENMNKFTVREVKQAAEARRIQLNIACPSSAIAAELISTATGTNVVPQDFHRADQISGPSIQAIKGKTTRRKGVVSDMVLAPPTMQQQQRAEVDLFFVKGLVFLHVMLTPMGLSLVSHCKSKKAVNVGPKLKAIISQCKSCRIQLPILWADNEGAIATIVPDLNDMGIPVDTVPAGTHCDTIERRHRTIKERVRGYDATLPIIMCRILLIFCVLFCVRGVNLVPDATSVSRIPPYQAFTGQRFNPAIHAVNGFGDYCQVTARVLDNSLKTRTTGCIVLLPTHSLTGSTKVLELGSGQVVTRDLNAIKVLPMPDEIIEYLNDWASEEGLERGY